MTATVPGRPLGTKHVVVGAAEVEAATAVLAGGDLSGTAAAVGAYEQALSSWFGSRNAVACSSGTAAVHLALLALGTGPGDEVIVPATAPVMTALPVLAAGAQPVFADVAGPDTFALDVADVAAKRSARTRAVVSVPMWGYPADGAALGTACRSWGTPLVEDAAQAHGSRLDGRPVGTAGAVGAFSTHARKLVSTGEGGFCLTDDDALADRLRSLHDLGRPAASEDGGFGAGFGLNYKLAGVAAAVGTAQLARLDDRLRARRAVAGRLLAGLAGLPGLSPFPVRPGAEHNAYAMVVRVHDGDSGRARQLAARLADAGIVSDTARYDYRPLYRMPVFAGIGGPPCPTAERLCGSIVTLPSHEGLTAEDVDRILATCRSWAVR